jgi:hypothetical protein
MDSSMKIKAYVSDPVTIYHDGKKLGNLSYDTFCLKVLSPKEFAKLERNPDMNEFEVRRIDLDQALAGWPPNLYGENAW